MVTGIARVGLILVLTLLGTIGIDSVAVSAGTVTPSALKAEGDWKPIQGEASRQDLFQRIKKFQQSEEQRLPKPQFAPPFSLPNAFLFPDNAASDDGKPRLGSIFGIDISHYTNAKLNVKVLKQQKIDFVYVKATQGIGYKDDKFSLFWKELDGLASKDMADSLYRGAYHFLSSSGDGDKQGESFINYLKLHGGDAPTDLPPVVDLEWDVRVKNGPDMWGNATPREIVDKALACLDYIQGNSKTHKNPMLYTSKAFLADHKFSETDFAQLSKYQIWIADYSKSHRAVEKPAQISHTTQLLWQFAENARIAGSIAEPIDANIYYGDSEKFLHDFQLK